MDGSTIKPELKKASKIFTDKYPVKEVVDAKVTLMRKKIIGEDRYFNRYWYFVRGASDPCRSSYIFVELSALGAEKFHTSWYCVSNIIGQTNVKSCK